MAHVKDNLLIEGTTGTVGKQIVLKKINGNTIMSKYPDMSQVEYNKIQIEYQDLFALAVEYAQGVLKDPARKAAYEKKISSDKRYRGRSPYHFALQCFMRKHSRKVPHYEAQKSVQQYMDAFTLTDRQAAVVKYIIQQGKITNSLYQQLHKVSKPTATRDLQELVRKQVITPPGRGAGAVYNLIPLPSMGEDDDEIDDEFDLI